MGLIKAAILIGAGSYAINKFSKYVSYQPLSSTRSDKSRSRDGKGCGCSHRRNRIPDTPNDPSDPNFDATGTSEKNTWTPGTKIRGPEQPPEYRDENAVSYQPRDSMREKGGWIGGEQNSWSGNQTQFRGVERGE